MTEDNSNNNTQPIDSSSTSQDIKEKFEMYLKDKTIDAKVFSDYIKSLSSPLKAMYDSLTQFSKSSSEVSSEYVKTINNALAIIKCELDRNELSTERRNQIIDKIFQMMDEIRKENIEERKFREKLIIAGVGTCLVVVGVGSLILTKGRSATILARGVGALSKLL